jgi:N-methylhydantoinase A
MAAALEADGNAMLARDGVAEADRALPMALDLRYPGQAWEIQAPLESPSRLDAAVADFHRLHQAQYAHAEPEVTPEIVTLRLAATGRLAKPRPRGFTPERPAAAKGTRRVFAAGGWAEVPVWPRGVIGPAERLAGPLIVEEAHATLYVPAGWTLAATPSGALVATASEATALEATALGDDR